MASARCLRYSCSGVPGPGGWCAAHALPQQTVDMIRRAADPAAALLGQAATDRRTRGTLDTRPVGLVLLCAGCGRSHTVPAAALDRPVQVSCGAWLKPAFMGEGG